MSTSDTSKDPDVEQVEDEELTDRQALEIAERQQFAQSGDRVDTSIGNMGGAGASGSGPDISEQSKPASVNSSDLPAGQR